MARSAALIIMLTWWAGCFEAGNLAVERGGFGSFYSYVRVVFWPLVVAGNEVPRYLFPANPSPGSGRAGQ